MSKLSNFLKANKKVRTNSFYAATKSLCDEKGIPLEWELRPLTSGENEAIRDACFRDGRFSQSLYRAKVIAACVVTPDLHDSELLDSYEAMSPEELICEMVDDPAEYNALFEQVIALGDTETIGEKVAEAKN